MHRVKQVVGEAIYTDAALALAKQRAVTDPDNEGFFLLEDDRTAAEVAADELASAKEAKAAQVKEEFLPLSTLPVADADGLLWSGGWDSATKLDAAKRLAEAAGSTTVTLYTDDNAAHTLTLPEALIVVLTVAGYYQVVLGKKQGFYLAIADASTVTEVAAIVIDWST